MGRVLEKFAIRFASKTPWEGTAEELLVRLREVAHVAGDKDGKDDLPKSPRWLSSRLAELAPAMGSRKVFITKLPRTNAARRWRIATFIQPDPDVEREDLIDYMADTGEVTGEVENDAKQD